MSKHWLKNFYNASRRLLYDTETGTYRKFRADELGEQDKTPRPGHFVENRGEIFGYSPSASGPIFFCGERQFQTIEGRSTGDVVDIEGGDRLFRLYLDGNEVVSVQFTPDPVKEYDAYEGDTIEFFESFGFKLGNPRFWEICTTE